MFKRYRFVAPMLAVYMISTLTAAGQSQTFRLTDMSWLAGCWGSQDKKQALMLTEYWMRPEGGVMLGMGRTVKDGRAVDREYMRIEQRGNDVLFIAHPKGNETETEFRLITLKRGEAVFENPDHDFPQRVFYRLNASGGLAARIEGVQNGRAKGIDFPMKRVSCP